MTKNSPCQICFEVDQDGVLFVWKKDMQTRYQVPLYHVYELLQRRHQDGLSGTGARFGQCADYSWVPDGEGGYIINGPRVEILCVARETLKPGRWGWPVEWFVYLGGGDWKTLDFGHADSLDKAKEISNLRMEMIKRYLRFTGERKQNRKGQEGDP